MKQMQKTISYNFSYNKQKYTEGKHYIKLEGAELKEFKANREIPDCHKFSAHLYLWTEKGARQREELLNDTLPGGMMGGYIAEDFPFYFINDQMLAYLGYQDEAEFIADIQGKIIN